jgi:hypothetical protein
MPLFSRYISVFNIVYCPPIVLNKPNTALNNLMIFARGKGWREALPYVLFIFYVYYSSDLERDKLMKISYLVIEGLFIRSFSLKLHVFH